MYGSPRYKEVAQMGLKTESEIGLHWKVKDGNNLLHSLSSSFFHFSFLWEEKMAERDVVWRDK